MKMESQDFPEVTPRDPQIIMEEAEALAGSILNCPLCGGRVLRDKAKVKVSVGYPETDGEGYGMSVDIAVHATCLQGMTEDDPRYGPLCSGVMEAAYEAARIVRDSFGRMMNG